MERKSDDMKIKTSVSSAYNNTDDNEIPPIDLFPHSPKRKVWNVDFNELYNDYEVENVESHNDAIEFDSAATLSLRDRFLNKLNGNVTEELVNSALNLLAHLPSTSIHEFFASAVLSIDDKAKRINICKLGFKSRRNDWQLYFRALIRHNVITDDPLLLFLLLDAKDFIRPEFLILCHQIKRPLNFRRVTHNMERGKLIDFLNFATIYATYSTEKQHDVIASFHFLPPEHSFLTDETQFRENNECMKILSHTANIAKFNNIPNPTFNVFEGVKSTIDDFVNQYERGELEKYQLQDRVAEFCTNPNLSKQIIEYISIDYPTLASRLNIIFNMQIIIQKPYLDNWKDTRCNDSRKLHSLIDSNQKVVSINDDSGINLALQMIRNKPLAIVLSFPHNNPRRQKDLAFISIYVENYLFLMRVDVLRANPHKIDALFALLSKTKLYTHFGNQLQQMIEKVTKKFAPIDIVEHRDLTKELGMLNTIADLSFHIFDEPYCPRTLSSPREKAFPDVMKNHLIIRHRILYIFATKQMKSEKWEIARNQRVESHAQSQKKNPRKRKNDAR